MSDLPTLFQLRMLNTGYVSNETNTDMSHFSYACKTEGENGISRLISTLCVNCLSALPEYSRFIDYSIIWMSIWCGLLQKLHKIKKSELLNSKVSFKLWKIPLIQFSNIPENFRMLSTQESGCASGTDHFRTWIEVWKIKNHNFFFRI